METKNRIWWGTAVLSLSALMLTACDGDDGGDDAPADEAPAEETEENGTTEETPEDEGDDEAPEDPDEDAEPDEEDSEAADTALDEDDMRELLLTQDELPVEVEQFESDESLADGEAMTVPDSDVVETCDELAEVMQDPQSAEDYAGSGVVLRGLRVLHDLGQLVAGLHHVRVRDGHGLAVGEALIALELLDLHRELVLGEEQLTHIVLVQRGVGGFGVLLVGLRVLVGVLRGLVVALVLGGLLRGAVLLGLLCGSLVSRGVVTAVVAVAGGQHEGREAQHGRAPPDPVLRFHSLCPPSAMDVHR